MSDYNEEAYENALIELFQNMGWEHVYGPDIDRDWHSPLYDSVLEDSIRRLNPKAAPAAIDEALLKLRHFENAELKKKNVLFMDYLQNGIEVSFSANGETKADIIYIQTLIILQTIPLSQQINGHLQKTRTSGRTFCFS